MWNVKTLKGSLNPQSKSLGGGYLALGQYDCASRMLRAFEHPDTDKASVEPIQTVKL